MYIKPISDLHLEFGEFEFTPSEKDSETILILAGDIAERDYHYDFIMDCCDQFYHVVLIHGNHEFYNGEYYSIIEKWKRYSSQVHNLHFLHDKAIVIDGVRILGCTLWTDYSDDPTDKWYAKRAMADYSLIRINEDGPAPLPTSTKTFTPDHAQEIHIKSKNFLKNELSKEFDGETVVVTHHIPSFDFMPDRFKGSNLNTSFNVDMSEVYDYYDIDYWIFGHGHYPVNEIISDTKFISNPRGYTGMLGQTENDDFDPNMLIKIRGDANG